MITGKRVDEETRAAEELSDPKSFNLNPAHSAPVKMIRKAV